MDPRGDARACPDTEFALLALPPFTGLLPALPPQLITTGKRRDCIRMRGLPYEASVNDIVTFLGDHSRQIVTQGVHLIYSAEVHSPLLCSLAYLFSVDTSKGVFQRNPQS